MAIVGVGLIGTGFMGKSHALAYRNARAVLGSELPVARLELLCDTPAERAAAMAERAMAQVNVDGIVRSAMASAGTARAYAVRTTCGGGGVDARGVACVDRGAINAEVRRALAEARADIAASLADGARERQRAMAELDRELSRLDN